MANGQPIGVRIAFATQIRLVFLITASRQDADALSELISSLVSTGHLPAEYGTIAQHTADALADLDTRLQLFLDEQGAPDAS